MRALLLLPTPRDHLGEPRIMPRMVYRAMKTLAMKTFNILIGSFLLPLQIA